MRASLRVKRSMRVKKKLCKIWRFTYCFALVVDPVLVPQSNKNPNFISLVCSQMHVAAFFILWRTDESIWADSFSLFHEPTTCSDDESFHLSPRQTMNRFKRPLEKPWESLRGQIISILSHRDGNGDPILDSPLGIPLLVDRDRYNSSPRGRREILTPTGAGGSPRTQLANMHM